MPENILQLLLLNAPTADLCEEACPYDAILPSDPEPQREEPDKSRKQFILYFLFIPLFAVAGAFILYNLAPALSGVNSNVSLAREIRLEKKTGIESLSKAVVAFKESGKTEAELFAEEDIIIGRFQKGSPMGRSFPWSFIWNRNGFIYY